MVPRNRTLPLWRVEQRSERDRALPMVSKPPLGTNKLSVGITTNSGSLSISMQTSTGFGKIEWWDGTTTSTLGSGNPAFTFSSSKTLTAASGKVITAFATNGLGGVDGSVTSITNYNSNNGVVDVSDGTDVTSISLNGADFRNVDWTTLRSLHSISAGNATWDATPRLEYCPLQSLFAVGSNIVDLDFGVQPSLTVVYMPSSTLLKSINVSGCSALNTLSISQALFQTLDLKNLSALSNAYVGDCPNLHTIDISGCALLGRGDFRNNALTTVYAKGCSPSAGKYKYKPIAGLNLDNNLLSATAINNLFDDLDPADPVFYQVPLLIVSNNPGSATCDPTIATAKGYVVIT
jgi:hypothetical protein